MGNGAESPNRSCASVAKNAVTVIAGAGFEALNMPREKGVREMIERRDEEQKRRKVTVASVF